MYKVFVNDRPIIFTSSLIKREEYPVLNYKDIILTDVIKMVKTGKSKGVYLYTSNLKEVWAKFCVDFRLRKAGGGLVVSQKKEILFIFRANKWDLPKGRIEANETVEDAAMREVKEETGLSSVGLVKFLVNTYHLYPSKGEHRLKMTYWYQMNTKNESHSLKPLMEEGIMEATFFNKDEIQNRVLKNTYKNIITVYNEYKKTLN
ncbi:NUDIX hydrolase [Tenacibaculum sp. MEBiC06402]|uniref:NUDIX hydrolase n=1 Tax=unclassified Tenacibaculum TaxID=2635139 RepID=UPI003B99EC78